MKHALVAVIVAFPTSALAFDFDVTPIGKVQLPFLYEVPTGLPPFACIEVSETVGFPSESCTSPPANLSQADLNAVCAAEPGALGWTAFCNGGWNTTVRNGKNCINVDCQASRDASTLTPQQRVEAAISEMELSCLQTEDFEIDGELADNQPQTSPPDGCECSVESVATTYNGGYDPVEPQCTATWNDTRTVTISNTLDGNLNSRSAATIQCEHWDPTTGTYTLVSQQCWNEEFSDGTGRHEATYATHRWESSGVTYDTYEACYSQNPVCTQVESVPCSLDCDIGDRIAICVSNGTNSLLGNCSNIIPWPDTFASSSNCSGAPGNVTCVPLSNRWLDGTPAKGENGKSLSVSGGAVVVPTGDFEIRVRWVD